MTSSTTSLKYSDRTDRAYGLCGMVFSLYILDAEKYIGSISIDAPADEGLTLTPEFYTPANPSFSVKSVWNACLTNFKLISAMLMGNLLARSYGRRGADLSRQVKSLMIQQLMGEGEEACGLDASEVEHICNTYFDYLRELFQHQEVNSVISAMAKDLTKRTSLSRENILAHLHILENL